MSDDVVVDRVDGVAVITINRPEVKNSVNRAVSLGIAAAVDELDARADLNIGILTGAGGTFSAGMDLKAFLAGEDIVVAGRGFGGICERTPRKPLIAAVEGWALAGGFELALACDLVVAGEDARFGIPEVKRSLVAGAGGLLRLPKRIPPAIAMEIALTGDPITARRAQSYGLINAVVDPGGAVDGALALAARISANGPLAVAATKQILIGAADWSLEEGFRAQNPIMMPVFASEDAYEGAVAFTERRPAVWKGR